MKTKLLPLLLLTFATNAFAALDTPTEDFTDNGDGTVLHKKTGLTWQRCSVGQTWTGSSCSGTASTMNWNDAMASYGKTSDCTSFRLPNIIELGSIVEPYVTHPAINNDIFPTSVPPNGYGSVVPYWSSSLALPNWGGDPAQNIYFGDGSNSVLGKDTAAAIRLVKGCEKDTSFKSSEFTDNKDGTLTNTKSGLMWQRCSVGQTWNGATCTGSPSVFDWGSATIQTSSFNDKNDWRLPSFNELKTIIDYSKNYPAIDLNLFPNTPASFYNGQPQNNIYWSATNFWDVWHPTSWIVDFGIAMTSAQGIVGTGSQFAIRLVRTILPSDLVSKTIDLSTTLLQSSSRVKINENLTYTATVTNNGTGTAANSSLKIYLPPRNVSVVSMPSDCATTGKSITCSLGNLTAGANASRAITVNYIKSGGASVSALVLTDSNDTNSANNVSRVVTAIKK